MPEEIPKFPKIEKVGISISVDKNNLEKLKEYIKENDPNAPISHPFNIWLNAFIEHLELTKKQKESEVKKESDEE